MIENKVETYPFSDALANPCRHVATIARQKMNGVTFKHGFVPHPEDKTATVSFVKYSNRTYAITARHVIEAFASSAIDDNQQLEGYFIPQSPGATIPGPFITPPGEYLQQLPDVAICPVDNKLPNYVGKIAFEIRADDDAKWPVSHALAVGFPTFEKHYVRDEAGGERLGMLCVSAVAEGLNSSGSSDQVQFHSQLPELPSVRSLSGMSGGPVFWSDGVNHGLLGFIKEALDVRPKEGEETFHVEPKVNFICQRVDHIILSKWLRFIDQNWQSKRDEVNTSLRSTSSPISK